jgi:hypothetical protein
LDGSGNIVAVSGSGVGPDNIIRHKAWGAASDLQPNPLRSPPASNTELISINNSVRAVLVNGDVRRNYIMTGATWFIPGSTIEVGTSKMNNATIETFKQGTDTLAAGTFNCFSCHVGRTVDVSHIFRNLKPLF